MTPRVSVIVVSYGTRDSTLAALDSVHAASQDIPLEAIVVDNASPDDSAEAIARSHPWATLLISPVNRGFAAGANSGAQRASADWLLFLNSDALLPDRSLVRLLEKAEGLDKPGAIGPRIEHPDGKAERSAGHFPTPWRDFAQAFRIHRLVPWSEKLEGVFIEPRPGPIRKVDWVTGACLLVERNVFQEVGGFDEAYFLYVEDMDLCFRLARTGRNSYYIPEITVLHERGRSRRPESPILIDGGTGPEYFIKKFGLPYPIPLQRALRGANLLVWLILLEARMLGARLSGRDVTEASRTARLCRRSLAALFAASKDPRPTAS